MQNVRSDPIKTKDSEPTFQLTQKMANCQLKFLPERIVSQTLLSFTSEYQSTPSCVWDTVYSFLFHTELLAYSYG